MRHHDHLLLDVEGGGRGLESGELIHMDTDGQQEEGHEDKDDEQEGEEYERVHLLVLGHVAKENDAKNRYVSLSIVCLPSHENSWACSSLIK